MDELYVTEFLKQNETCTSQLLTGLATAVNIKSFETRRVSQQSD